MVTHAHCVRRNQDSRRKVTHDETIMKCLHHSRRNVPLEEIVRIAIEIKADIVAGESALDMPPQHSELGPFEEHLMCSPGSASALPSLLVPSVVSNSMGQDDELLRWVNKSSPAPLSVRP